MDRLGRRLLALDVGIGKGFVSLFGKGVHAGMFRVPLVPPGQRRVRIVAGPGYP